MTPQPLPPPPGVPKRFAPDLMFTPDQPLEVPGGLLAGSTPNSIPLIQTESKALAHSVIIDGSVLGLKKISDAERWILQNTVSKIAENAVFFVTKGKKFMTENVDKIFENYNVETLNYISFDGKELGELDDAYILWLTSMYRQVVAKVVPGGAPDGRVRPMKTKSVTPVEMDEIMEVLPTQLFTVDERLSDKVVHVQSDRANADENVQKYVCEMVRTIPSTSLRTVRRTVTKYRRGKRDRYGNMSPMSIGTQDLNDTIFGQYISRILDACTGGATVTTEGSSA